MSEYSNTCFKNVTITKAANIYFDGRVSSRRLEFADGNVKTLGIMAIGEYEFATVDKEIMELVAGEAEVLLPNKTLWETVGVGQCFEICANASFKIRAKTIVDYCCSYITE